MKIRIFILFVTGLTFNMAHAVDFTKCGTLIGQRAEKTEIVLTFSGCKDEYRITATQIDQVPGTKETKELSASQKIYTDTEVAIEVKVAEDGTIDTIYCDQDTPEKVIPVSIEVIP